MIAKIKNIRNINAKIFSIAGIKTSVVCISLIRLLNYFMILKALVTLVTLKTRAICGRALNNG